MTGLVGWLLITVVFGSLGMGSLYPGYRIARRFYPDSKVLWWSYCAAAALIGLFLWLLLPFIVHQFFGRASY